MVRRPCIMMEVGPWQSGHVAMTSPVIYNLMSGGQSDVRQGTRGTCSLPKTCGCLMWFPYGQYHFAVRADSDIEVAGRPRRRDRSSSDPRAVAPTTRPRGWIESTTGLVVGRRLRGDQGQLADRLSGVSGWQCRRLHQWLPRSLRPVHPVHRDRGHPLHRPGGRQRRGGRRMARQVPLSRRDPARSL